MGPGRFDHVGFASWDHRIDPKSSADEQDVFSLLRMPTRTPLLVRVLAGVKPGFREQPSFCALMVLLLPPPCREAVVCSVGTIVALMEPFHDTATRLL